MPEEGQHATDNQGASDEIAWTVQRSRVLFRYWTMPLLVDGTRPSGTAREDTISARAFALLVIVALTFAVRGNPSGTKVSFTLLAAAVAGALSFLLNLLAKTVNVTVREPALISAYASTILVMLGFLFVRSVFPDANWMHDYLADYVGPIVAAAIVSVVVIYLLLVLKAVLWDRNRVSARSALVGLAITIGSGAIVCIVYYISNDAFDAVINLLCRFAPCR